MEYHELGVYLFFLFLYIGTGATNEQKGHVLTNSETTQLLDELVNKMDFRVRPNVDGGPVKIKCSFYIINFGEISESNMDYSMDIYLRQYWTDKRLQFENTSRPLTINAHLIDKMWQPDLFFPTEKKASFHDVTVPNKLMRIYPDGQVIFSMRLTLTLSCPMDLTNFPMDQQNCEFNLASYAYETNDLNLEWVAVDAFEVEDEIELPQFDLAGVHTIPCKPRNLKTGSFPCLKAKFSLRRQYGFFLLQTYIPSILIVIISWVSFWINMDAVPARISLGVTTVLTMATQLSGSKASIPRISYPKAIDIWMAVCMFFVFSALIEYAFVNALSRKDKRRATLRKKNDDYDEDDGMNEHSSQRKKDPSEMDILNIRRSMKNRQTARIVDKVSRILFPLIFILFNLFYWPYFTYNQQTKEE